ncbi:hypothetical protein [Albidovulum sp.]
MTALKEYQRLECTGLWRDAPGTQRREVIVAFGDATLVISDSRSARALAHWSLPAVVRLNPGERPARFGPDGDAAEELEIDDETMIAAIGKLHRLLAARRPHPGRLRAVLTFSTLGLLLAAALLWLPGAMIRHTARMLPQVKRAEIGAAVLADLTRVTGLPCEGREGVAALARLAERLLPEGGAIHVLPAGLDRARPLPGGSVVLSRAFVETSDAPEIVAGQIVATRVAAEATDPLIDVLDHAGLAANLRLLTTGSLPDKALAGYGERLLATPPRTDLPLTRLLEAFGAAGVPTTPFAYAIDPGGETTLPLIEADPFRDIAPPAPVMSDGDWVALQGICAE